jgi:hypothetical protein
VNIPPYGLQILRFLILAVGLILILSGIESSLDLEDYLGILLVSGGLAL